MKIFNQTNSSKNILNKTVDTLDNSAINKPQIYPPPPPPHYPLRITGFTLIELLVVVIIIGILAAIALPQYQKAVYKSKISGLLVDIKAVADAQKIYFLEKGEYALSFSDLIIEFPSYNAFEASRMRGKDFDIGLQKLENGDIYLSSGGYNNGCRTEFWGNSCFILYYNFAKDDLFCVNGLTTPLTKSCNYIGFTRTDGGNCRWNPCYRM
jgi:prepilin-type N-terminal cleavage/methylation domain-containing protein